MRLPLVYTEKVIVFDSHCKEEISEQLPFRLICESKIVNQKYRICPICRFLHGNLLENE